MTLVSSLATGGLLERGVELAQIGTWLADPLGESGFVLVVEGAAGVGKSALLAAARARAEGLGFEALSARASEFEAEIAFGVVRQLFEPVLRRASGAERRHLLAGVAQVGARALVAGADNKGIDRFAAIHGLYWLCANRAERHPLLVAIDDVQWIDDPSLSWLGYVARRASDLPLALALCLRAGEPGDAGDELKRLLADRDVRRLTLQPLTAAGVAVLVREQLDDEADEPFTLACWELTGGNPFFARELLAAARTAGLPGREECVPDLHRIAPAAVGTSVLNRLDRLGADAVSLAGAVAVLGGGADVTIAARMAGLDPLAAELIADRLAADQILAATRPLEFFHPLIAAVVLADLAPGARRLAHRRAASILDAEADQHPGRVASHLLASAAAGDHWVVGRLREAAQQALDQGAPEVAAKYIRRALLEPPATDERCGLMLLLGTAEWRAGQTDAIAHLEQARSTAGADLLTRIQASGTLARAYVVGGQPERAVETLEDLLRRVADENGELALRVEAGIAIAGMLDDRVAPAALERAAALRRHLDSVPELPVQVLLLLANFAARTGRVSEAEALAERVLSSEPYPPPIENASLLIATLAFIERYDALQRLCRDALVVARRRGAIQDAVGILVSRAWALYDCGALADAEADARWALERAEGIHRMHAISDLVRILIERNELDAAERELGRIPDPRDSHLIEVTRLLISRGRLRAAQGRPEEALDDLQECGRRCGRLGLLSVGALSWRGEAALVHAAIGRDAEARRLAAEQLKVARISGGPRTLGASLRASGVVEGGATGIDLLQQAVTTLETSQSPLELARALADLGAALRRAGYRTDARAGLQRALDLAHHCGARRIGAAARSELIAAGFKPRRDAITGRDALTDGELRVARLAAEGLSNREIAQALFITTKTAKTHLSRVYRKLDIARRGELASALSSRREDATTGPAHI